METNWSDSEFRNQCMHSYRSRMGRRQRALVKVIESIPDWGWDWMKFTSRVAWSLVILIVPLFVIFNMDRTSPSEVTSITATDAPQGGVSIVSIAARYDDSRDCLRQTYRWITDAAQDVYFIGYDDVSAEAREKSFKSKRDGDGIVQAVPIPMQAAVGPARYVSSSAFVCNYFQSWFPIRREWSANFNIKPRR